MRYTKSLVSFALFIMAMSVLALGCDKGEADNSASGPGTGAAQVGGQPKAADPGTQPIIPVAQIKDWCPEHAMPESICVRCNDSLAAGFKAKGDWDEKHRVPRSQCFECDPALKQKFAAAYKEKYGAEPPAGGEH